MDKFKVFLGYLAAAVIGSVAVFILATVTLVQSFDEGMSLAVGWFTLLLMGLAIQSLVEYGRLGHTLGLFLRDFWSGLRGDGDGDGDDPGEQLDNIPAPTSEPSDVLVDRTKLESALRAIVTRYHAGQKISRKACQDAGVTDQRYWNLANGVLVGLGMRSGSEYVSRGGVEEDLEAVLRGYLLVDHGKQVYSRGKNGETQEIVWAG